MDARIGLVGLGNVGGQLAGSLLAAGVELQVHDLSERAVDAAVALGATSHGDLPSLGAASDIVLLSLPTSDVVDQVVLGDAGLLSSLRPHTLIIDMSTTLPERTLCLAEAVTGAGGRFLDAPVSFGPRGLVVFAGGSEHDYADAVDLFDIVSFRHYHVGPTSHGQHVKLLQNLISGVYLGVVAETIGYGERAGIDLDKLRTALRWTGAHSRMVERSMPAMLRRDYGSEGTLAIHLKDIRYALETGEGLGAPMPFAEAIRDSFQQVADEGEPGWTQAALLRRFDAG